MPPADSGKFGSEVPLWTLHPQHQAGYTHLMTSLPTLTAAAKGQNDHLHLTEKHTKAQRV